MDKDKLLEQLREDIVVPDSVQRKADGALRCIAEMSASRQDSIRKQNVKGRRIIFSRKWLVLFAAVFICAAGVIAAYRPPQVPRNLVSCEGQSDTDQGITVSVEDCITFEDRAYIILRVDGLDVADEELYGLGLEGPGWGTWSLTLDGRDDSGWGRHAGFYNGFTADEHGKAVREDGLVPAEGENVRTRYVQEDGSLIYQIYLYERGKDLGGHLRLCLQDFVVYEKKDGAVEPSVLRRGSWTLEWDLQEETDTREYHLEEAIGDTGVTGVTVRILPDLVEAAYHIEKGNGQSTENTQDIFPDLFGIKTKEGELVLFACMGYGSSREETEDTVMTVHPVDRLIPVHQIESLLFVRSLPKPGEPYTEENFYEIPLNG